MCAESDHGLRRRSGRVFRQSTVVVLSVSSGLSPISTGNSVPSLRRPTRSRTTPIARDRGSAWNDVRCPRCWPRNPRLPRRRPSTGCLGQQPGRVFACMYQRVEPLPHIIAELHHIPLRSNLFRRHAASPEINDGVTRHPRAFASAARPHVLPVAHDRTAWPEWACLESRLELRRDRRCR